MDFEAQIDYFLRCLKTYVSANRFIYVPREPSELFMASRGMSPENLKNLILSLTPERLHRGPERDQDPRYSDKWTVAIFYPVYNGELLYLKVSINIQDRYAKCLSVKLNDRSGK